MKNSHKMQIKMQDTSTDMIFKHTMNDRKQRIFKKLCFTKPQGKESNPKSWKAYIFDILNVLKFQKSFFPLLFSGF